ncbi:AI-2E family transporter [Paenibacillus sambharensis]|uniref:AI-2E family transporter n=1 Tax=Paenibacillus sambharensis TaxID=1803190 RepID=UPI001FE78928|nr:AI-2E family transporter [Paenibacillus sambharensis]
MLLQSRFFRWCLRIICILLILYLGTKVSFIFRPLVSLVNLLLIPVMLAGFFYYLLRPLIKWLDKLGLHRKWSVPLLFIITAALLVFGGIWVWPPLREQIESFIDQAPEIADDLTRQVNSFMENDMVNGVIPQQSELWTRASEYMNNFITGASDYMTRVVSFVSSFVIVIATAPILLFYMLKEGGKLQPRLEAMIPRRYRAEGGEALEEIDEALSSYIVSRVVVNVALGVFMYIGFLIIDLPYSLLLTLVSIVLNFIPYIGALLATVPVVIVALIESPMMALWSVIIIFIAQQIQDNVVSPLIYGKSLAMHPVTVVALLLVGGDLAGIVGMLLIIPMYMVVRIIAKHAYKIWKRSKESGTIEIAGSKHDVEV